MAEPPPGRRRVRAPRLAQISWRRPHVRTPLPENSGRRRPGISHGRSGPGSWRFSSFRWRTSPRSRKHGWRRSGAERRNWTPERSRPLRSTRSPPGRDVVDRVIEVRFHPDARQELVAAVRSYRGETPDPDRAPRGHASARTARILATPPRRVVGCRRDAERSFPARRSMGCPPTNT